MTSWLVSRLGGSHPSCKAWKSTENVLLMVSITSRAQMQPHVKLCKKTSCCLVGLALK